MEILLGTTLTFSNALYSRKLCLQQKKKKKKSSAGGYNGVGQMTEDLVFGFVERGLTRTMLVGKC